MVDISIRSSRQFLERAACKGGTRKGELSSLRKLVEALGGRWRVGSEVVVPHCS